MPEIPQKKQLENKSACSQVICKTCSYGLQLRAGFALIARGYLLLHIDLHSSNSICLSDNISFTHNNAVIMVAPNNL